MAERKMMRRAAAMIGAAAIGMTAMAGASSAAFAAPQGYGDIDFDRTGSLTVHKYLHQSNGSTGDISEAPAEGKFTDPVKDVVFTVYPLLKDGAAVDLSVAENWNALKDLQPGANCAAPEGYELGAGIEMPATDAKGEAKLDNLSIGAYQVCETKAPENIIDKAAPFIVTLPMPHKDGWVYDVHAYPKNGEGKIEKSIEKQDPNTGLGSVVKFPVTVPIPTTGEEWTGFAIRDTLDERLTPVAPQDMTVKVDGTALNASYYEITVEGQQITMNFTEAGLNWLNESQNAQAGKEIEVVFAGTITKVGDGTIKNTAELWPNNPGFSTETGQNPPIPSNEVKTYWGDLKVTKRAAGTTGNEGLLTGAVFEVYNAEDPYAADCSAAVATGDALTVNDKTQFTSEAGVVSIPGLFVSDSENDPKDAQQRCYVLKEVAAPAGYVLPADASTGVAVKIGQTTETDVEIENTQQDVPELPLTGAAGQVLLIAAGVAAVALAAGLVLMNRRKTSIE